MRGERRVCRKELGSSDGHGEILGESIFPEILGDSIFSEILGIIHHTI